MVDRISAPFRLFSDTAVDMSRRVALTQRLIEPQLFDLEIGAGGHRALLAKS